MSGLTFYSPGAQNPPILEFLSHRQDPIRVSITCVSQVQAFEIFKISVKIKLETNGHEL